jgi:hypothetical protein
MRLHPEPSPEFRGAVQTNWERFVLYFTERTAKEAPWQMIGLWGVIWAANGMARWSRGSVSAKTEILLALVFLAACLYSIHRIYTCRATLAIMRRAKNQK